MSDQEMSQEIDRLRRELADVRQDRDTLHKMLCSMIPVERLEMSPEEFEQIRKRARPVDEVLRDLLPPDLHHLISARNGQA